MQSLNLKLKFIKNFIYLVTLMDFITTSCAIKPLELKKVNKINTLFDKLRLILLIESN